MTITILPDNGPKLGGWMVQSKAQFKIVFTVKVKLESEVNN